jgi:predicted GTPase
MSAMDEMMEAMLTSMSKEEKQDMMEKMMEKFFSDMTVEDKQRMMEQMMPKMMEGINFMEMMPRMMMGMMGGDEGAGGMMGMMSQMMGGAQQEESPAMPNMMTHMMPHCINMMLPNIPKEERVEFVLDMVETLIKQGSAGMTDEEKDEFMARILEKITS